MARTGLREVPDAEKTERRRLSFYLSFESLKEEASGTVRAVFLESQETRASTDGGSDHFETVSLKYPTPVG